MLGLEFWQVVMFMPLLVLLLMAVLVAAVTVTSEDRRDRLEPRPERGALAGRLRDADEQLNTAGPCRCPRCERAA